MRRRLHLDCQETARKRCSERRRRYEKARLKRELIPFEEERKQERDTGRESSFPNAKQRTENEHGAEGSRQSL